VVEPRDGTIKLGAGRFRCQAFLPLGDLGLQSGKIEILDGCSGLRKDRKIVLRKFGQASEDDKPVTDAPGDCGHEPRTKHGDDGCVTGKNAEIALSTRQIHLIDLARK
jgi:hypothetical protein